MKRGLWAAAAAFVFLTIPAGARQKGPEAALQGNLDLARQKVYPAVVNITVVARYFSEGRAQRAPAGGSGVIVSREGHVLTNFHVAGHTTRITCTLTNGESINADVVTHDPLTDLSVLKLRLEERADPKAPLPSAELGDSDQLKVGDPVLAMGNPLMLSSSVTLGIVSNTKRVFTNFTGTEIEDMDLDSGERTGTLTRWIQHDALILPGNSGGPLVNQNGEVVGINELGGSGVGFAIPSNIAKRVLKEGLAQGEVRRGWLGVKLLPVEKLNRSTGALVAAVVPDSPAEAAGLVAGDIILQIGETRCDVRFLEQAPLLYQQIAALEIGSKVEIRYLRGEKELRTTATVAKMARYRGEEDEILEMGVTAQEVTPQMAQVRQLPVKEGILLTGLRPGYAFETAQPKLNEGDVISAVDGKPTPSLEAFRKALGEANKKQIVVTYQRRDEQIVTVVKMPDEKPREEGGELPKPWLAVKTQVLTPDVAKALKLEGTKGFRVTQVYPWTEAAKSGLQVGDVITALNGTPLKASRSQDAEDLKRAVEDLSIGDKAELSIIRGTEQMKVAITLEPTRRSSDQAKSARQKEFEFIVREITDWDRFDRRWNKEQKGVLVTEVTSGGWAHMAGLRLDDLLVSVNGEVVSDVGEFEQAMQRTIKSRPKAVQLFVRRGFSTNIIFIEPVWSKLGGLE